MGGEEEIVEAHSRIGVARMAVGILLTDDGREEEGSRRDGVAGETEDIEGRKIDG